MLKRPLFSLLLSFSLSLSLSLHAGAANSCAELYTPVKKSVSAKNIELLRGQTTVWGKTQFQQLQAMTRDYRIQTQRGVSLENIRISNNPMMKETLDWMIVRLESPELLNKFEGETLVQVQKLSQDMKALKDSASVNYQEFLRVSHDFSYRIEGRKDVELQSRFLDVTTSSPLDEFFLLPSQIELSAIHINEMMAEGLMPLGLVDRMVTADGIDYSPSGFFSHDLGHAAAGSGRIARADYAKFRDAYWIFKSKIQIFPATERPIYENLWFLLTHEIFQIYPGEKEMLKAIRDFNRDHGGGLYDVLYRIHDKNSDLKKMSKEEFMSYMNKLEKILAR